MEILTPGEDLPAATNRDALSTVDEETRRDVRRMLANIRDDGWPAVVEYSQRFDDVEPSQDPLSDGFIADAWNRLDEETRDSLRTARARIDRYQRAIRPASTLISDRDGALGEVVRPLDRVGCYVPGGRFPLPSTVLMTAGVADVAGVNEIVIATPPGDDGRPHPVITAACHLIDSVEVYALGGVQAVGAMAFGAGNVNSVDLIAGPGNVYVTLAKKEVYGRVDIDMLAGPSEIAVVAEPEYSNPDLVAADLLSQAEHDPMARSYLFTTDRDFAESVDRILGEQLNDLPDTDAIETALSASALVVTQSLDEALNRVNELAPEHLELHTQHPGRDARRIDNAGAVFLGQVTPEPYGDYMAGPSHTLPTGGSARFFSPLSVRTFLKSQSLIEAGGDHDDLMKKSEIIAGVESLPAHANSVAKRAGEGEAS